MVDVPDSSRGTHRLTVPAGEIVDVNFNGIMNVIEIIATGDVPDIWWTADGSEPVPGGDNCYWIPAGAITTDTRQIGWRTGGARIRILADGHDAVVSVARG